MGLAETAELLVKITGQSNLSGVAAKDEAALGKFNTQAKTSGTHVSALVGAAGKAGKAMTGLGGAISHATGKIGGLLTGPLGLIGLTGGVLSLGGAIESSVKKIEDFGTSLEKVQTLTGETAQQSGALILLFEKYGLSVDQVSTIAGFAEKTLGKLNTTTAKSAAATKSAALQNLELVKAQRQAAGQSTTAINKLISEQKARDQIANAAAGQAASVTKLAALDKQYGLSLVDSKGKVVDFSTELEQLAKFYDSNASASTKAYVASQVLGRGYTAAIPILNGGSAAILSAAAASKQLGLDQAGTVAQIADFRNTMRDLGETVNILQLRIGMALIPALDDAAKAFSGWLGAGGSDQIISFFKSGATFAGEFADAMRPIVAGFQGLAGVWNGLPGPLKDLLIGGAVAQKAGSFLFGKSLIQGGKNLLGSLLGNVPVVGGTLDTAVGGVQHVWVDNPGFGGSGGLPNVIPLGPGAAAAAGGVGGAAAAAIVAIAASPLVIAALQEINHKAGDPTAVGNRYGFYPGKTAADLPLAPSTPIPADQRNFDRFERAIQLGAAAGVKDGLIHNASLFHKAQAVREAAGIGLSRDVLIADLHKPGKLGTGDLVTAQAMSLAAINHLRTDTAPNLKSAAATLALLKRTEARLPADMAGKLVGPIHSLEAAINRTTAAVKAVSLVQVTQNFREGNGGGVTNTPRRLTSVQSSQNTRGSAGGFLGLTTGTSDLGIAGEAGQEAVAIIKNPKKLTAGQAASAARVFVTNWPKSVDSTSKSSSDTAQATSTLAKATVKETTQKQMAAALKAIKERAIAAGHTGAPGKVKGTYEHDIARGFSLDKIINTPVINANVSVSARDVNTTQDKRLRWGKTPTQVGAM